MAKKDIRIETPLAWDEYKNKTFDQALPIIYSHAQGTSAANREWYWKSIKSKRNTSLGIRAVTFILLIVGTLFPILAGLGDSADKRLQSDIHRIPVRCEGRIDPSGVLSNGKSRVACPIGRRSHLLVAPLRQNG